MVDYGCFAALSYKKESDAFREAKRLRELDPPLQEAEVGEDPILHGTEGAALKLRRALIQFYGYNEGNIILLLDRDVPEIGNAGNVLSSLTDMVDRAKAGDTILFYYGGHGACDEPHSNDIGRYFLACSNNTYISGVELHSVMKRAHDRYVRLTVLLDCCLSSGLFQGLAEEQIGPFTEGYRLRRKRSDSVMIASCRKENLSLTVEFCKRPRKYPEFPLTCLSKNKKYVGKRVSSTLFMESFWKVAKKTADNTNGAKPQTKQLISQVAEDLIEARVEVRKNRRFKTFLQQPQLSCSWDQAVSTFPF